jgi:hypothetical protein
LRADGLRVWLDAWEIRPGDSIPAKIEDALEHPRVLACPAVASGRRRMLCMSAHAFGSNWAQLEAGAFRFRDPLYKERRFISLRLDAAPIKASLGNSFTSSRSGRGAKKTSVNGWSMAGVCGQEQRAASCRGVHAE